MVDQPPKPRAVWTAAIETTDDGYRMARVWLDVGQYSFLAGSEIRNDDDFPELVARLISAITSHARRCGWL